MKEEKTQIADGVASKLNAELGSFDNITEFDPFDGDNFEVTRIKDKMITARKDYVCQHCYGIVHKGTLSRNIVESLEGKLHSFRFCTDCCKAMVLQLQIWNGDSELSDDLDEDIEPFEERYELFKV